MNLPLDNNYESIAMNEKEWVRTIIKDLEGSLNQNKDNHNIRVEDSKKIPYSSEILSYSGEDPVGHNDIRYETDILVYEKVNKDAWIPRVIIEAKIGKITTHDAITYSQKARTHKNVHPYLRYGILIGNRLHHPLPGRLFRHGQHFDFMLSWKELQAADNEWNQLITILNDEIKASRTLEEMIYRSRSKSRIHYTSLHKPLRMK